MKAASRQESSKLIGIAATTVFHVVLLLICLAVWLGKPSDDEPLPPVDDEEKPEITFEEVVDLIAGGTYVAADFIPPEPEPKLSAGSNVEAAPPLPPEPTQEEIEQKISERIRKTMTFNTQTETEEEGDGGDATATVAASDSEFPETDGLDMFDWVRCEIPRGKLQGKIAIRIKVSPDGDILEAEFYGPGTVYDVIKDKAAVESCLRKIKESKLKLKPGSKAPNDWGYIYYRFR